MKSSCKMFITWQRARSRDHVVKRVQGILKLLLAVFMMYERLGRVHCSRSIILYWSTSTQVATFPRMPSIMTWISVLNNDWWLSIVLYRGLEIAGISPEFRFLGLYATSSDLHASMFLSSNSAIQVDGSCFQLMDSTDMLGVGVLQKSILFYARIWNNLLCSTTAADRSLGLEGPGLLSLSYLSSRRRFDRDNHHLSL